MAVAFDLGKNLSVGVAAAYWQLELDSFSQHLFFDHDTTPPAARRGRPVPELLRAGADSRHGRVFSSRHSRPTTTTSPTPWGAVAGERGASVGAAYRKGTEYDISYTRTCGPAGPRTTEPDWPRCTPAASGQLRRADLYGVGFASSRSRLTLTLDWNRVAYSEMTDDVAGPPEYASELRSFETDDADEVRFGFEYVFRNVRNPVSVRAGIWLDPAHQMGYRGASEDLLLNAMWAAADQTEDEEHMTAGVGWLIANHLTLDLGFDVSDRVDTVGFQAGYRF